MNVIPKEKIRAALERQEALGSTDIEAACTAAAQALGIPVEVVQEVAYELREAKAC